MKKQYPLKLYAAYKFGKHEWVYLIVPAHVNTINPDIFGNARQITSTKLFT